MIYYLKRNQLDITKYNACIKHAINARIYAYSWYLDCVADNWDVLVLNDYEAVMPLPWRQKFFIKYIYPPAWTQQLGVFSPSQISKEEVLDFINAIPKKFKKITIQFNAENKFQHKNLTKRVNYVLPLNASFEEIYNRFRKDRKARIKEGEKYKFRIGAINNGPEELIRISKKDYSFLNIPQHHYSVLKKLFKTLSTTNNCFVISALDCKNEVLGGVLFLKDDNRITYLFSVACQQGKKQQVISAIIYNVIKKHADSNYILDFEGSMVTGIADFYKSFGSTLESYSFLQIPSKSVVLGKLSSIKIASKL